MNFLCDDYIDSTNYNSGWQVNVTTVTSANLSNTRFGTANLNPSYPSGTTLYEQMAWLFTQTVQPGQSTLNQDAIGEAVWFMTGAAGTTPTATSTNTGANRNYLDWITLAQNNYNKTTAGYTTPDYDRWTIVTDIAAKGNTGGVGKQEMLAYYTASGTPNFAVTSVTPTPEPSYFILLGLAFPAAGVARRRHARRV